MSSRPPVAYAGFVTRGVALIVDAIALNAIAVLTGGAINLIASLLGADRRLSALQAFLGGAAWLLWIAAYFVTFWTLTGQTPGDRLLGIRVLPAGGGPFGVTRGILRFVGMVLALIPLGAGFLPVLVDDRRRGLHDRIAGTVVVWDEARPAAPEPGVPGPALSVAPVLPSATPRDPPAPQPRRVTDGSP